ncbi:Signal transduction histidine kinase [Arboricoccus pini]|uniref:histidine kinase n=1 Tax=Arboricoccus pini TaxID=1963835 RepID=A0A212QNT4_9PROT|nr:HAMP domain-containing sensor histidine kinase [Arboricoccus pini]SNB60902.1 Signal transduction histidine kinase [Arboricoccus pini]
METIDAEIQGLDEQSQQQGILGLKRIIEQRSSIEGDPDRMGIYLLVDWDGNYVAGNLPHWPDADLLPDSTLRFSFETVASNNRVIQRWVSAKAFVVSQKFRLLVGRDITEKQRTQQLLWSSVLVGTSVMILLGLGGGFVVSRWTLGRIELINRTTTAIMGGNLGKRIQVEGGGDEFDELATNLNAMLERIQRLLAGMREVTDNIAHDLRTPLSRIRSRIEVAMMHDLSSAEAHELLEATVQDADKLIETFNALLNIARAEAGSQRSEWEEIGLCDLARDVVELYEPLAEVKNITLRLEAKEGVSIIGSRQLVAQALANITDNAIKYTPENGVVTVTISDEPSPTILVADNGPGIAANLREKALERFVRLDPDRSSPGNGLGLSLVSAVARLHEAKLTLDDNNPGLRIAISFRRPSSR